MADWPAGTITFLFTDIEGSTRLWEQHPEAMGAVVARHDALLIGCIRQQDGMVVKSRGEGDSLFAVFARATDAVAAAAALQQALQTEPWPLPAPLRVRAALHTGEAELREGDYYGAALNRCGRLRAAAHGGQVLLSLATQELVRDHLPAGVSLRDLGECRLKDLARPERVFQLLHPELPAEFPPLRSLDALPHNLPQQITTFIGREREITAVKQLLAGTRLVTLTGSGGTGKSRLSLQVAADLLEEYPDGVWLVELAALADPALVPGAVATVLGVREEPGKPLVQTLANSLKSDRLLLILDNCEHLLAACAGLAESLLRSCPRLQILASSREGLNLPGEQTYRVPSLSVPDPRQLPATLTSLTQYEAVRLFIDRAVLQHSTFAVTNENAPAVAQICHRLDGIPLAIELAAARVKALPVEQVAARLDGMFRLLTGGSRTALPRQQTLRALIDWSYDLLTEPERALLRRLSVFAGGWILEAAESVCAAEGIESEDVVDLLTELVGKSLVVYEDQGEEARYHLLETVRQYARDRLLEAGNAAAVRDRHRDWFVALAERAEPKIRFGGEQVAWLDRLEREHDNLRAALEWCNGSEEGKEAGLRMATALGEFWVRRGHTEEGWQRLTTALDAGDPASAAARGKALRAAIFMAQIRWEEGARSGDRRAVLAAEGLALGREAGDKRLIAMSLLGTTWASGGQLDNEQVVALREEALTLAQEAGDRPLVALLLRNLSIAAVMRGDDALARTLQHEALDLNREMGNTWQAAADHTTLGWLAQHRYSYDQASAHFREALALWRGLDDRMRVVYALGNLAQPALEQGEYGTAGACYEEALAVAREQKAKPAIAEALVGLATVAQAQGDDEEAQALREEARALYRELGDKSGESNLCIRQGHGLLERDDYATARSCYEEDLALRRAAEDRGAIACALLEAGHAPWLQGEPGVTRSHAVEALALFREQGNQNGLLAALETLAAAALAQSQQERAARLLGAAEALREGLGLPGPDWWHRPRERIGAAARAASLAQAFAAAWAEGRRMKLENAITDALEAIDPGRSAG